MKKFFITGISILMSLCMFNPVIIHAEDNSGPEEIDNPVSAQESNDQSSSVVNTEEHIHEFGDVQYTWSDDNTALTAERKCLDQDCGYIETENATVTADVKKAANCIETGTEIVTGTFTNEAFETQTKEVELSLTDHLLTEIIENGTTYWVCEVCGKAFSDEKGTEEITAPLIAQESADIPDPKLTIKYQAHIQNLGWKDYTDGGQVAGTTSKALHMEALKIDMDTNIEGSIQYRAHVRDIGWQNYVGKNEISGTTGRNLGMEAIEISLTGDLANYFDIYYRVHSSNFGWLSWAKNGQRAGSQGYGLSMEAIQIVVVKKGENPNVDTSLPFRKKGNGTFEVSNISLSTANVSMSIGETATVNASADYTYWTSAPQNITAAVSSGNIQMNVQNGNETNGWSGKVTSTIQLTGTSKGVSTITVTYPDGSKQNITVHVIDPNSPEISYSAHVRDIGWQNYVDEGTIAGTTGRALRMEALKINVASSIPGAVEYRAHVQNIGWKDWVSTDQIAGTVGCKLPIEAVSIRLTGELANRFDIYYRVHSSDFGWLGWASNGADAGSQGYARQVEAIQIVLVAKGNSAPGSTSNPFYYKPPRRSIPYYNQKDPRWSSINIGGNTIGSTGCGTCVYSMAFSSILNRTILPNEMASYLYSAGEFNNHNPATGYWGTTGRSHLVAAQHYGVHCDVLHSWEEMVAALQANKIVSICVGPGMFFYGSGSHELLMYGMDINSVSVLDPLTQSKCHNYSAWEVYNQRSMDQRDWDAGGVVYAFY